MAGVPIIMLTARAQESDIEQGFEAGADDYVVKPFSPRSSPPAWPPCSHAPTDPSSAERLPEHRRQQRCALPCNVLRVGRLTAEQTATLQR